ncbi:MAG: double-strand break repair protein AddB [Micavibrio sp.]
MNTNKPTLFNIPAGLPFGDSFAAVLLQQNQDHPEKLAETLVLLPTRRACRIVREAFLRQSGGVALLLPRMQTLGDVDEDSLSLEIAALGQTDALNIPPALSPMRRRVILVRLIMQRAEYRHHPDQALALADALAQLIDRIHTEGLDMAALPSLVGGDFAQHWQITLDFLTIISEKWPEILAAHNAIDAAERRNLLLVAMARHWEQHPPPHRVIAAGSTGSIPATAALLKTIASLPQGSVVLPGLDQQMDETSWRAIDDTHPQATLKTLLEKIGIGRDGVRPWPSLQPHAFDRNILAREVMRPAATTESWRDLSKNAAPIVAALNNLQRIDCATAQEEARLISLIFRHVQHTKNRTAALVTFDRDLARRVAAICTRWGLQIDDTAGQPLATTKIGSYLALCAGICVEQLAPIPLLALLKHHHAGGGADLSSFRSLVRQLDYAALRGPRPGPGLMGLRERIAEKHGTLSPLIDRLELCFAPLLALCDGQYHPFRALLDAHLAAAEAFADGKQQKGADRLWTGEDGEAAALFLSDLRDHAGDLPDIRADQYVPMLQTMMRGLSVRPAYGAHPRLMIMGPLEARMIQADLVILSGLNEGSWPPAAQADPWMSRPMRKSFGLPSPERGIGLSAHDFVQGFCAKEVILTRAERAGTSPTIPSRWLQRLDTVLAASGLALTKTDWLAQARNLDHPADFIKINRPAPKPPAAKRPVQLSVTEIETWMRDPYAIYARRILDIKPVDPVDQKPDASDRGTILHETLEQFTKKYPHTLPDTAYDDLTRMGHTALDEKISDPKTRHFWGIRFDQAARWFFDHEIGWRSDSMPLATEVQGVLPLPGLNFTLTAKADRIDSLKDGSGLAVIDYKTGAHPTEKQVVAGLSPQLSLEAAMVREGAFPELPASPPAYLGYWKLGGGRGGGKETRLKASPDALADQALLGLENLVRVFANDETPYYSLPRPACKPKFQNYAHLARVQEWAVLDDSEENGA